MKVGLLFIGLVSWVSGVVQASAPGFGGSWRGTGHWTSGFEDNQVATVATLTVELTTTALRFEECWDYRDRRGTPKHSCINSAYDRDATDGLFRSGNKVGNVFSDHIVLFDVGPQVSEQIVFQLSTDGLLHYRYSFLSFDGATERRDAVLSLVP